MKSYWFLFWAYAVFWLGLAGFMFFLIRRQSETRQRIDRLENELTRKERGEAS